MNNFKNCGCSVQRNEMRCHCPGDLPALSPLPENPVAAMAYVPFQEDDRVYEPLQALAQGTLFPSLNKPFTAGERCGCA